MPFIPIYLAYIANSATNKRRIINLETKGLFCFFSILKTS